MNWPKLAQMVREKYEPQGEKWAKINMAAFGSIVRAMEYAATHEPWVLTALSSGFLFCCGMAGYTGETVDQFSARGLAYLGSISDLGEDSPYGDLPPDVMLTMRNAGIEAAVLLSIESPTLAHYSKLIGSVAFQLWCFGQECRYLARMDEKPGTAAVPPPFREYLDSLGGAL